MKSIIKRIEDWFNSLFEEPRTIEQNIDPQEYGWELTFHPMSGIKDRFHMIINHQTYVLYLSMTGKNWVFDRTDKSCPGVLARFDVPLLKEDLQYCNEVIKRMESDERI